MYCKSCGEEMNEKQAICLKCGVKKGNGNSFCANCGNPVNPGAEVCLNCGVAIKRSVFNNLDSQSENASFGKYSKITMLLVTFFLGEFGIHNFMLGEYKKGFVKLGASILLSGAGWLIALYDFYKIITDKYEIDPDKFI